MKKLILSIFLLLINFYVSAQGIGIAEKMDSFIESDLRPILRSAGYGGVIIGGIILVWYLFIGDGQRAKKALGNVGWGVIAVSTISLVISYVGGQN